MRTFTKIRDLDIKILLHLSYKDLISKCVINKYINSLCEDKNLWRNKIAKDFPLRGKFIWYSEYRKLYDDNPRKLYEIIAEKSKIIYLNSEYFPKLVEKFFDETQFQNVSEEDLNFITNMLPLAELELLRGDVIQFSWIESIEMTASLCGADKKL